MYLCVYSEIRKILGYISARQDTQPVRIATRASSSPSFLSVRSLDEPIIAFNVWHVQLVPLAVKAHPIRPAGWHFSGSVDASRAGSGVYSL